MERIIKQARSQDNGILFYSSSFPFLGVKSIITDNGQYVAGPTVTIVDDIVDFFGGEVLKDYVLTKRYLYVINLVLLIISLEIFIYTKNYWIIFAILYFIVFSSKYLYQFILFAIGIKFGKAKILGRFHAAEHMVVEAYNNLKRVPTISEIKEYSRFSKYCGSMTLIKNALLFTIITLEMIIFWGTNSNITYCIVLCITLLVYIFNHHFGFFKYLQIFLTNKPTEVELQVALEGIKEFDKLENAIKSDNIDSLSVFSIDPELEIELYEN